MKIEFKEFPNGEPSTAPFPYVEFREDGTIFCNQFGDWIQEKTFRIGLSYSKERLPDDWRGDSQVISISPEDKTVDISCGNGYSGSSNRVTIPDSLFSSVVDWLKLHAVKHN